VNSGRLPREEAERLISTALGAASMAVRSLEARRQLRDLTDQLLGADRPRRQSPTGAEGGPAGEHAADAPAGGAADGGAADGWAAEGGAASGSLGRAQGLATGSDECCICPICRVIAAIRDPSPEFAERLATGAGDLAAGVAEILRAFSGAGAGMGGWAAEARRRFEAGRRGEGDQGGVEEAGGVEGTQGRHVDEEGAPDGPGRDVDSRAGLDDTDGAAEDALAGWARTWLSAGGQAGDDDLSDPWRAATRAAASGSGQAGSGQPGSGPAGSGQPGRPKPIARKAVKKAAPAGERPAPDSSRGGAGGDRGAGGAGTGDPGGVPG
jgi:hypothetical protein